MALRTQSSVVYQLVGFPNSGLTELSSLECGLGSGVCVEIGRHQGKSMENRRPTTGLGVGWQDARTCMQEVHYSFLSSSTES